MSCRNSNLKTLTDNTPQISSHLQCPNNVRPNYLSIAVDKYINTLHHIQENLMNKKKGISLDDL